MVQGHDVGMGGFFEARNYRNGERMLVTIVDPVPVNVLIRVVAIGKVVGTDRGISPGESVCEEQFRAQLVPNQDGEGADGRHLPQLVDTGSLHGFSCASHLKGIGQGTITTVHNDVGPASDFEPEGLVVVFLEDLQGLPHHGRDHEPPFTLV